MSSHFSYTRTAADCAVSVTLWGFVPGEKIDVHHVDHGAGKFTAQQYTQVDAAMLIANLAVADDDKFCRHVRRHVSRSLMPLTIGGSAK